MISGCRYPKPPWHQFGFMLISGSPSQSAVTPCQSNGQAYVGVCPMGESFNAVQFLDPPFLFVDERVIFIPRKRRLEVNNRDIKIILFLEGTVDLLLDGQPVGRIKQGDVLIVPRRCRQTYVPVGNAEERLHVMRIWFDFSALRLDFTQGASGLNGPPTASDPEVNFAAFLRHHFKSVKIVNAFGGPRIQDWVRLIRQESECRAAGYRFRVTGFCRLIVTELVRQLNDAPLSTAERDRRRTADATAPASWAVEHVKQFLFENCRRPLELHEIAWEVKLSAEHLCRRFKEETGQTVFNYLRELRLEAAKAYLVSSKQTITEIADKTGFSSSTLFCRVFRKAVGQTPMAYRAAAAKRIQFQNTTLEPDEHIF